MTEDHMRILRRFAARNNPIGEAIAALLNKHAELELWKESTVQYEKQRQDKAKPNSTPPFVEEEYEEGPW